MLTYRSGFVSEFHFDVVVFFLFPQKQLRDKCKFSEKVLIHSAVTPFENGVLLLYNLVGLAGCVQTGEDLFCHWKQCWFTPFDQCALQRLYLSA